MLNSIYRSYKNYYAHETKKEASYLQKEEKKRVILKSSYLLNDMRNFNETFRKNLAYANIKSHKKQGFSISQEKPERGGHIEHPSCPAFFRINMVRG